MADDAAVDGAAVDGAIDDSVDTAVDDSVDAAGVAGSGASGAISTERLVLRPLSVAESAAVAEGVRLEGWAADFPAEADMEHAALAAESTPADPFSLWLVVERDPQVGVSGPSLTPGGSGAGLVVGSVGLEEHGDQAELYFGIVPSRRGRGFGAEAVRALVAHVFAASAVVEVIAMVEVANAASLRALERAGFADNGFPAAGGVTVYEARRV